MIHIPMRKDTETVHVRVPTDELQVLKDSQANVPEIVRRAIKNAARKLRRESISV
jgi:post-segregation antitoxin (ccd killing protein)